MNEDDVVEREWDCKVNSFNKMNDHFAKEPHNFGGGAYF